MPKNLTQKILEAHLIEGKLIPGEEIGIKIDQILLQDATGTMAMLEFEAMGLNRVKAELAVQYVDHNILQTDSRNADDHRYLQTACARYGLYYSPAGKRCVSPGSHGKIRYSGQDLTRFRQSHAGGRRNLGTRDRGRGGWMWRWRWLGSRIISHVRRSLESSLPVNCPIG